MALPTTADRTLISNPNNNNDLGDGSTLNNEEAIATTPDKLGCNNYESMAETQKTRTLTECVLGLRLITVATAVGILGIFF